MRCTRFGSSARSRCSGASSSPGPRRETNSATGSSPSRRTTNSSTDRDGGSSHCASSTASSTGPERFRRRDGAPRGMRRRSPARRAADRRPPPAIARPPEHGAAEPRVLAALLEQSVEQVGDPGERQLGLGSAPGRTSGRDDRRRRPTRRPSCHSVVLPTPASPSSSSARGPSAAATNAASVLSSPSRPTTIDADDGHRHIVLPSASPGRSRFRARASVVASRHDRSLRVHDRSASSSSSATSTPRPGWPRSPTPRAPPSTPSGPRAARSLTSAPF